MAFRMVADAELQASLFKYASSTVEVNAREYLFRQGEDSRGCYLIKRGTLALFMEGSSGKRLLGRELGEGCIVGLPATINGNPLSLTCRVTEDAELALLTRDDLARLMRDDVAAAMKILDLLSTEVQSTRKQVAKYARPARPSLKPGT
ncbi:MAG: cyclic nucleotide-binding domain-containing protein [Terriglobia bacterium]|jgi:CRP-like cAMP-binding protein|nr:cyclic nucleotide-binding domain-containing protein [Terriglobia bacterium]